MTFRQWLRNSIDRYKTEPIHVATTRSAEQFAAGVRRRLGAERPPSNVSDLPVFARGKWDVLIVLDACRPDVLRVVSQRYPWCETGKMDTYPSVATYSKEWLERTFTRAHAHVIANTALVSWNPYTDASHGFDQDQLGTLRQPYYQQWDDAMGMVTPDVITEHAIDVLGSERNLIAWYQQPHAPHRTLLDRIETLTAREIGDESIERTTIWNLLRAGELDPIEAHAAYTDSLIWCLEEIRPLVAAAPESANIVITADHAELFGEGGYWGHPKQNDHPTQIRVPWLPVDQSKLDESPQWGTEPSRDVGLTVNDRLRQLGYR